MSAGGDAAVRGANPFLAPGDEHLFYATAQITQRLNLLHHLCRYSDQVMVLMGPEGSGKTTFTDRLLREGQNASRATVVEAHGEATSQELLARALAGLDVHAAVATEMDAKDGLRAHLSAAAKSGLPTLLVVDDAQFLAAPVLELLLRLAQDADYPGLRLLLVGEPDMGDRVAGALGEAFFHLVELPALGREQCMHYITTRLDKSGTPARDLFTPDGVDRLWKESGGYPGPLNRLAARVIDGPARSAGTATSSPSRPTMKTPPARTPRSARGNRRLLAVIGSAALLLTLAITTLLPDDTEERDRGLTRTLPAPTVTEGTVATRSLDPGPRATPAPSGQTGGPAEEAPGDPAPPGPPTHADGQTGPVPDPSLGAPTAQAPAETAPQVDAAGSRADMSLVPETPAPLREQAEGPPKATSEAATRPPPAVIATVPTPATPPSAAHRQPQGPPPSWPFNLAGERYVLQLMGSRERAAVARLVARHQLGQPTSVVALVHEGQPWHVLVHGSYASRDEAVGAIRTLSPELRALRPWARSVASLRANLASTPP